MEICPNPILLSSDIAARTNKIRIGQAASIIKFWNPIRAAEDIAKSGVDQGLKQVDVFIKGPGQGRESAIRALTGIGLTIKSIRDITPIPHNGCRPPKRRRV